MKVLVSGLGLSSNLGAPAMALSLMYGLRKRFREDIKFVFTTSVERYEIEQYWANRYGVEVVVRDSYWSWLLRKSKLKKMMYKLTNRQLDTADEEWEDIHTKYIEVVKNADYIIAMEGISYVGDGVRSFKSAMHEYSTCIFANKYNRPYCRFIQSFGPFDDKIVRYFAKREFKQLPFVPARGMTTAGNCRSILDYEDKNKVFDFPDVAIVLPVASEEWLSKYLSEKKLSVKEYIVLSPSAVIYQMKHYIKDGCVGDKHIECFVGIADELIRRGEKILFLAHMYSPVKEECDREICYEVINRLKSKGISTDAIRVVEDDIDPMQAKALIKASKCAVVSRFHALVAAVSTLTPVVTIGWNIKYYDLMSYYGNQNFAFDVRNKTVEELADTVVNAVYQNLDSFDEEEMHRSQTTALAKVENGFDMLESWMRSGNV